MNLRSLKKGSRVLCEVRGIHFTATVKSLTKSNRGNGTTVTIDPDDPKRITYRNLGAREIKEKLSKGKDAE